MSNLCWVMHVLYVYALKLLSGFFWDKVCLFLVETGWQSRSSGHTFNKRIQTFNQGLSGKVLPITYVW